jgi:hypothetical protein
VFNYLTKLYELGALPVIRPGTTQQMAISATAAVSAQVGSQVVRLVATSDCHIAIGAAPTATAAALFLPANTPEYFACNTTDLVAVIQDSAAGSLYITPAV